MLTFRNAIIGPETAGNTKSGGAILPSRGCRCNCGTISLLDCGPISWVIPTGPEEGDVMSGSHSAYLGDDWRAKAGQVGNGSVAIPTGFYLAILTVSGARDGCEGVATADFPLPPSIPDPGSGIVIGMAGIGGGEALAYVWNDAGSGAGEGESGDQIVWQGFADRDGRPMPERLDGLYIGPDDSGPDGSVTVPQQIVVKTELL